MRIVARTELNLKASKGLLSRLGPSVFLLVIGGLFLFIVPLYVSIICWALAGILMLIAVLFPDTITVNRSHEEIIIRKPIFGLFAGTRVIPFKEVEAVQVGYRRYLITSTSPSEWQVTLILTNGNVTVSHSRNELRMRQLGSAISKLTGAKFVSDTYKPKYTFKDKGAHYYSGIRRPFR